MTEEEKEIIENFKNYINVLENRQEYLYDNEEFYKEDIEQNELLLKMLRAVLKLIYKQDITIDKMAGYIDLVADEHISKKLKKDDVAYWGSKYCIIQYFKRKGK